jgi:imidazoleglycerol phosphate synthase glutamine amidotransferase subunit HisH
LQDPAPAEGAVAGELLDAAQPGPEDVLGTASYGGRFACAAEHDNVFGVQFHPEKSSAAGLRLLANFAGVCAREPIAS